MWTVLGSGQLLKDDKGRYYPTNPTNPTNSASERGTTVSGLAAVPNSTNRSKADTYGKNGDTVGRVSRVSAGHALDCMCEECLPT
jgi:hypothetical protein